MAREEQQSSLCSGKRIGLPLLPPPLFDLHMVLPPSILPWPAPVRVRWYRYVMRRPKRRSSSRHRQAPSRRTSLDARANRLGLQLRRWRSRRRKPGESILKDL